MGKEGDAVTSNEVFEKLFLFARCATLQLFCCDGYKDEAKKILNAPSSIFSGCFYKQYILSVYHGCLIEKGTNGTTELGKRTLGTVSAYISSEDGIRNQILSPMWLAETRISKEKLPEFREIDFFMSRYDPSQQYRCEIANDDTDELYRYERIHFDEINSPVIGDSCFFCGNIESSIGSTSNRIFSKTLFASCEFCGELPASEGKGSYLYKFELPNIIKSLSDLEGCSGAPIFNIHGKLVSLVSGGWENTPYIYGVNLELLQPIIEDDSLWQ